MRTATALIGLVLAVSAGAQSPDEPDTFGTAEDAILIIGRHEFQPCGGFGNVLVCAALNGLPNGAVIKQIAFYPDIQDSPPGFTGYLRVESVDSATGATPWLVAYPVSLLTEQLGRSVVFENVDVPVLYRQDMNGDGELDVVSYYLQGYTSTDINFLVARVRWRRQVSPAPQSATFNDVPTSDGAFQFIEALVSSGITVGCGEGNYCPDAPVTRRQMAVFLAKALGLHWPWNAQ